MDAGGGDGGGGGGGDRLVDPRAEHVAAQCCRDLRQSIKVGAIGRARTKAGMRALAVVEIQIADERGSRRADPIIGMQAISWPPSSRYWVTTPSTVFLLRRLSGS